MNNLKLFENWKDMEIIEEGKTFYRNIGNDTKGEYLHIFTLIDNTGDKIIKYLTGLPLNTKEAMTKMKIRLNGIKSYQFKRYARSSPEFKKFIKKIK